MNGIQALAWRGRSNQESTVTRSGESELLSALAAGSRSAAEELVERTYGKIYGALLRLCGDEDLAADLTQETYRRAWKGLTGFRGGSQFSTWLYRIAYTTFLNHVRRPRPVTSLEEVGGQEPVDPRRSPEEQAALLLQSEDLRRAVLALPDDLRFTVTAHFFSEEPVREIARHQRITAVAVRKRLKKALRLLALAVREEAS
jgi:RNA polymerase sigma-70 factor (ECF subfamily)